MHSSAHARACTRAQERRLPHLPQPWNPLAPLHARSPLFILARARTRSEVRLVLLSHDSRAEDVHIMVNAREHGHQLQRRKEALRGGCGQRVSNTQLMTRCRGSLTSRLTQRTGRGCFPLRAMRLVWGQRMQWSPWQVHLGATAAMELSPAGRSCREAQRLCYACRLCTRLCAGCAGGQWWPKRAGMQPGPWRTYCGHGRPNHVRAEPVCPRRICAPRHCRRQSRAACGAAAGPAPHASSRRGPPSEARLSHPPLRARVRASRPEARQQVWVVATAVGSKAAKGKAIIGQSVCLSISQSVCLSICQPMSTCRTCIWRPRPSAKPIWQFTSRGRCINGAKRQICKWTYWAYEGRPAP